MDFINFVGVALTFATIGFGGYALIRFVNLKFRRLEGGTPSAEVLAELDDLRVRVQELEGDRGRVLELEERVDFAERLLSRQADVPPAALRAEGERP